MKEKIKIETHNADICVVGGGMAGICAAISAARNGSRVVLMHDRPVLGGNASSECRVHICGADRHSRIKNLRETGILEELRLENLTRNPNRSYSIWDLVLFEKIKAEQNITLVLNCSCFDTEMDGNFIVSISGWQTTTQVIHKVRAKIFIDCSGDAIVAPLTGALYRMGREAKNEFNESYAPDIADSKTMGMSCMFMAKEYDTPQKFQPPSYAYQFDTCDQLPYGKQGHSWFEMGYWWIELGGEYHSIYDTEKLRDELLKIVLGVWDHIKNRCPDKHKAKNWALEWLQFLPAKRESRRYIGEHVLTQNDIESEGKFDDIVAYGGWPMDDHHPAGFFSVRVNAPSTIFHPSPSPYGIPYRCLYSKNITNLMFAGRNASCTHIAMSSTRVMGTGCSMGQAAGTAAAIAIKKNIMPADVLKYVDLVQQTLLYDDAYIPYIKQQMPELTHLANIDASKGNPEPVRDGINRPVGKQSNGWKCQENDWISYTFTEETFINKITLIVDSGLDKLIAMSHLQKDNQLTSLPDTMPAQFRIDVKQNGRWKTLLKIKNNNQRLFRCEIKQKVTGIKFVLEKTYGVTTSCVYAFYCE
ncbi:MAG TPA: FAD-dependent oxidoreductase [bacterium]|nr:FAD-dependent oxidoreductase [bacterium]HOL49579.1 FAD-dependent oxidoreductase [bacterium]HPO51662.1 FAD-dependent oxidoreductase [bacterium]